MRRAAQMRSLKIPVARREYFSYDEIANGPKRSINKKKIVIIVLLIIVFATGLGNAFYVFYSDDNTFDPNRSEDSSMITVSGEVIDKDTGDNLKGVVITILGANQTTITNSDGWFTFENVKLGKLEIEASKNGYKSSIKKLFLSSDSFSKINFELEQGSGDVFEKIEIESTEEDNNDINRIIATIFAFFACFALPAIGLILYRKFFWLVVLFVIISMLSIGYFIGVISGAIALLLIFSSKNDFEITFIRPISKSSLTKPLKTPPPPPPPLKRPLPPPPPPAAKR